MQIKIIGITILLLLITNFIQAQTQDSSLVRIETRDNNTYVGKIVDQDEEKVVLETNNIGTITIPKTEIKFLGEFSDEQIKDGKLWLNNPQSTRYFWSPNGYGLKQGEGYYQNIWVLWNQFSYGATDNFSIGGGVIPLFLFGGGPTPVFLTPKLSIPLDHKKVNLGLGGLFGTVLGESETGFGILYGLSTFGTPDNNVSLGLGYGYAGGDWANSPLINVSGMFRISSRGYIITENYYISAGGDGFLLLTVGGRWIIKKAALDFGLLMPAGDIGSFIAVPWLGFTIPFGNSK